MKKMVIIGGVYIQLLLSVIFLLFLEAGHVELTWLELVLALIAVGIISWMITAQLFKGR
jgi:hypothetical protein